MAREHARTTDPSTSHKAAAHIDKAAVVTRGTKAHELLMVYDTATSRLTLPDAHLSDGLTAEEACLANGHPGRAWQRVYDLLAAGYLHDTGRERPSFLGKRAQRVLAITDAGVRVLQWLDDHPDERSYRP